MAKQDSFDDFGDDFDMDEFFPMDDFDGSNSGGSANGPVTFKSYTKNLLGSAKKAVTGTVNTLLPNVGNLFSELGMAKDETKEALSNNLNKITEGITKKTAGKTIGGAVAGTLKEFATDMKKAVTTGDLTFGTNKGFSFDMGFEDDDYTSDEASSIVESSHNDTKMLAKTTVKVAEATNSTNLNIFRSKVKQDTKMFVAGQNKADVRHFQSVGYIANIDTNVAKIVRYMGTVGTNSVAAQMEFSEKSLAMQQDSISLLNAIREQTFTPPNTSGDGKGSKLDEIFGFGLNGSSFGKAIVENVGNMISNSPLGMLMSGMDVIGSASGMDGKKTAGEKAMGFLLPMLPGLLLSSEAKQSLDMFNENLEDLPGAMNNKFVTMAMNSSNPLLNVMGNVLGVKETTAVNVDLGVKDLGEKALFDKRFYHTVTDAIPGFLSKILAATNGEGEIFFDHKLGTFKKASHAVKEYEYEKKRAFNSSFKYNMIKDKFTAKSEELAKETRQKPTDVSRDFDTIFNNIQLSTGEFSPSRLETDTGYRKSLLVGVNNPANLDLFTRTFQDTSATGMTKEDQNTFKFGLAKAQSNIRKFYKTDVTEMINRGSGGSFIANKALIEHADNQRRNIDAVDMSWKYPDKESMGYKINKMKRHKMNEELELRHGGRVETMGDNSMSSIDDAAKNGAAKSSVSVLSNIYELLLGGILVYPKGKVPEHLVTKINKHNEFKTTGKSKQDILDLQEQERIDELTRDSLYNLEYAEMTKRSAKSLLSVIGKKKEERDKIWKEHGSGASRSKFNDVKGLVSDKIVGGMSKTDDILHKVLNGSNLYSKDGYSVTDEMKAEATRRNQVLLDKATNIRDVLGVRSSFHEGGESILNASKFSSDHEFDESMGDKGFMEEMKLRAKRMVSKLGEDYQGRGVTNEALTKRMMAHQRNNLTEWTTKYKYKKGDKVTYKDRTYLCLKNHSKKTPGLMKSAAFWHFVPEESKVKTEDPTLIKLDDGMFSGMTLPTFNGPKSPFKKKDEDDIDEEGDTSQKKPGLFSRLFKRGKVEVPETKLASIDKNVEKILDILSGNGKDPKANVKPVNKVVSLFEKYNKNFESYDKRMMSQLENVAKTIAIMQFSGGNVSKSMLKKMKLDTVNSKEKQTGWFKSLFSFGKRNVTSEQTVKVDKKKKRKKGDGSIEGTAGDIGSSIFGGIGGGIFGKAGEIIAGDKGRDLFEKIGGGALGAIGGFAANKAVAIPLGITMAWLGLLKGTAHLGLKGVGAAVRGMGDLFLGKKAKGKKGILGHAVEGGIGLGKGAIGATGKIVTGSGKLAIEGAKLAGNTAMGAAKIAKDANLIGKLFGLSKTVVTTALKAGVAVAMLPFVGIAGVLGIGKDKTKKKKEKKAKRVKDDKKKSSLLGSIFKLPITVTAGVAKLGLGAVALPFVGAAHLFGLNRKKEKQEEDVKRAKDDKKKSGIIGSIFGLPSKIVSTAVKTGVGVVALPFVGIANMLHLHKKKEKQEEEKKAERKVGIVAKIFGLPATVAKGVLGAGMGLIGLPLLAMSKLLGLRTGKQRAADKEKKEQQARERNLFSTVFGFPFRVAHKVLSTGFKALKTISKIATLMSIFGGWKLLGKGMGFAGKHGIKGVGGLIKFGAKAGVGAAKGAVKMPFKMAKGMFNTATSVAGIDHSLFVKRPKLNKKVLTVFDTQTPAYKKYVRNLENKLDKNDELEGVNEYLAKPNPTAEDRMKLSRDQLEYVDNVDRLKKTAEQHKAANGKKSLDKKNDPRYQEELKKRKNKTRFFRDSRRKVTDAAMDVADGIVDKTFGTAGRTVAKAGLGLLGINHGMWLKGAKFNNKDITVFDTKSAEFKKFFSRVKRDLKSAGEDFKILDAEFKNIRNLSVDYNDFKTKVSPKNPDNKGKDKLQLAYFRCMGALEEAKEELKKDKKALSAKKDPRKQKHMAKREERNKVTGLASKVVGAAFAIPGIPAAGIAAASGAGIVGTAAAGVLALPAFIAASAGLVAVAGVGVGTYMGIKYIKRLDTWCRFDIQKDFKELDMNPETNDGVIYSDDPYYKEHMSRLKKRLKKEKKLVDPKDIKSGKVDTSKLTDETQKKYYGNLKNEEIRETRRRETQKAMKEGTFKGNDDIREGSFNDHRKDAAEERARKAQEELLASNKKLFEVVDKYIKPRLDPLKNNKKFLQLLEVSGIGKVLKKIEGNTLLSAAAGGGGLLGKAAGILGVAGKGLAVGGIAAGIGAVGAVGYSAVKKIQQNNKSGIRKDGTAADRVGQFAGSNGSSNYGYDGKELTKGEQSAQSFSLLKSRALGRHLVGSAVKAGVKKFAKASLTDMVQNVVKAVLQRAPNFVQVILKYLPHNLINKAIAFIIGRLPMFAKNLGKGGLGKIGKNVAKYLGGPIGIGFLVMDFVNGWHNANRYFSLGKGAKVSFKMNFASGISNVLSNLTMGIIPGKWIAESFFKFIGSEKEKSFVSEFHDFMNKKAKILGVQAKRLMEYETKRWYERVFGNDKQNAKLLGFDHIVKYITWRDKKYKPVEELRKRLAEKYGGDKVVGGIAKDEQQAEKINAFRKEFLAAASALVGSIKLPDEKKKANDAKKPEAKKDETKKAHDEEFKGTVAPVIKDDPSVKKETPVKTEAKKEAPAVDTALTAGVTGVGAASIKFGYSDVAKQTTSQATKTVANAGKNAVGAAGAGVAIGTAVAITTANDIDKTKKEMDKVNESVGVKPAEKLDPKKDEVSKVVTKPTETSAKIPDSKPMLTKPNQQPEKQEPVTKQNEGSPVISNMKDITNNINTELDALRAIVAEQNRHNGISEVFYTKMMELMAILVDNSKASFDGDLSRNEILAKTLLAELDPEAKKELKKAEKQKEKQSWIDKLFGRGKDKELTNDTPTTIPSIGFGNNESSSVVPTTTVNYVNNSGSKIDLSNGDRSLLGDGELTEAYTDPNATKMGGDTGYNIAQVGYKSGDGKPDATTNGAIESYKKANKVGANSKTPEETNRIIKAATGTGYYATHEVYSSAPIMFNGVNIGTEYVYIPKLAAGAKHREGDIYVVRKFKNGDVEYAVDNTLAAQNSGMGVKVGKGEYSAGSKAILIRENALNGPVRQDAPVMNADTATSAASQKIASGKQ